MGERRRDDPSAPPSRARRACRHRGHRSLTGRAALLTVLPTAMAAALGSCAGGSGEGSGPAVDTLAGGVVVVRNPLPATDGPAFELVEELRVGGLDGEGPEVFAEIRDLEVDAEGRMYVLDFGSGEVRVFDRDGAHVWSAGRRGEGPGELSSPSASRRPAAVGSGSRTRATNATRCTIRRASWRSTSDA